MWRYEPSPDLAAMSTKLPFKDILNIQISHRMDSAKTTMLAERYRIITQPSLHSPRRLAENAKIAVSEQPEQ